MLNITITLWTDQTWKGLLRHRSPVEPGLAELVLELKAFLRVPQVPEAIPPDLGGLCISYFMVCLVLFFEMGFCSVAQAGLKFNM